MAKKNVAKKLTKAQKKAKAEKKKKRRRQKRAEADRKVEIYHLPLSLSTNEHDFVCLGCKKSLTGQPISKGEIVCTCGDITKLVSG